MSNKHAKTELEKEFELERLVLFSDAVFAIAITLLVIDIKFPGFPSAISGKSIFTQFKPMIYQFFGFLISFTFIGSSWSNHLKLFRHLRKYDQGLIKRNLVYLFFIVIFPFTASAFASGFESGVERASQLEILFGVFLYIINITCVTCCHFILCHYIFHQRPGLSAEENSAEKKYIYADSKYSFIMLLIALLLSSLVAVFSSGSYMYVMYSLMILPVMKLFVQRKMKKYKPRPSVS
jgi:TMEM175 potassium channel family protein